MDEAYGPTHFELIDRDDLPPLGDSIVDTWQSGPNYNASLSIEDQKPLLDLTLKKMLCQPTQVLLRPVGKYAGVSVTWLPGHLIGDGRNYGPAAADVMVIGYRLNEIEVRAQRHWIGEAARTLGNEFARNDLNLRDAYGTHLIKYGDPYPKMKNFPAAWIREGLWFLRQEILLVNPRYILCFSAHVLKALFGRQAKFTTVRGQVLEFEHARLMVTDSPNTVVANPERLMPFRNDIARFCKLARGGDLTPKEVEYTYIRDEDTLHRVVDECMQYKVFAMDCEWAGDAWLDGHLLTIQFSVAPRRAYVVILRSDVERTEFSPSPSAAIRLLRKLLQRGDVSIVGHNFRADIKWLIDVGLDLSLQFAINGFDTMLAHHLIFEQAEHGLSACALVDTDMGRYDHEVEKYLNMGYVHSEMPEDVLLPYAAADADVTYRLYEKYRDVLWADHVNICREKEVDPIAACVAPYDKRARAGTWIATRWNLLRFVSMPVNLSINEMEMTGMTVDRARLAEIIRIFRAKSDELRQSIRDLIHEPEFNPDSADQRARLLFGVPGTESECTDGLTHMKLGLTPIKTTGQNSQLWEDCIQDGTVDYSEEAEYRVQDGERVLAHEAGWRSTHLAPSTDLETLGILAEDKGCEEARQIRDYRLIQKICTSFMVPPVEENGELVYQGGLGAFIKRTGRIHTTIGQLTDTGRYTSSRPNLQQLPKGREGDFGRIFSTGVPPVRSCFVAAPGHVMIEADFESAELYTLAWLAGDERMKQDLEKRDAKGKKVSLHTTQAINIFKLDMTPDEFDTVRKRDGPEAKRLGGLRTAAKSVNFGQDYTLQNQRIC